MVNTKALFFSLLYNEELLCVFRYKKKKSAFRVGKKELLDTKKESRKVFKVVVVFFFFRCVLGFAHVFSLSLSFLGDDDKKKTLPLFAKVQ